MASSTGFSMHGLLLASWNQVTALCSLPSQLLYNPAAHFRESVTRTTARMKENAPAMI